jgi:hypothetical protein
MAMREAVRTGARTHTDDGGADRKPEKATGAVAPGFAGTRASEQPPEMIMPTPKNAPHGFAPMERANRDLDEARGLEDLHAEHRDQKGQDVRAQDRHVAGEDGIRDCACQAEAPTLDDVTEVEAGRERRDIEQPREVVHARMLAKSIA